MKNRIAQSKQRDYFDRAANASSGRVNNLLLFTSSRANEINIADMSKLPVVENNTVLQNNDGDFYFFVGYSIIDGPDIIP